MLCPVCNGLTTLDATCPLCGAHAHDEGRLDDYKGPYSPYDPVPIGEPGSAASTSVCQHWARCPSCRDDFFILVEGWQP